ncbi:phasin family protein [Nitrincola tibetensis]|uniref:Phasin family protein n=1 Tax=Nitrincola tibetensis TaxID=2219697 RepID=A0A364NQM2_9GAMM|nr:phasin family protein [Nitrincola tibetensis]RAU19332.1 phasin family protein [Nitrincola tibetensis]
MLDSLKHLRLHSVNVATHNLELNEGNLMTDPLKDLQDVFKPVTELSESLLKNVEEQLEPVKEKLKPALEMAEVNKSTAEKLIALQSDYVSDFVNTSLAQFKALVEAKDPQEALHLQVEYFKTLDAKFTHVAEKELAALTEAKDKITEIVEKSFADIGDVPFLMPDLKSMDFSKFDISSLIPTAKKVEEAAEEVKEVVEATVEKAAPAKTTPARKISPPGKATPAS